MTYLILPIPPEPFRPLFDLGDGALVAVGARRMVADGPHQAPCRVSLVDAEPGERLILTNYVHLAAPTSPYRGNGPVFVREAAQAVEPSATLPDMIVRRLISARVYDADALMVDADVMEGSALAARLGRWFEDDRVVQVHLHTARRGCYLARAVRA